MQYFYLATLCESLKLPRVQSFHQLLHGSLSDCDHGLQSDGVTMRIMVFKGIFTIVIMGSMVINITMIKVSMVIMVMLFVITMSE